MEKRHKMRIYDAMFKSTYAGAWDWDMEKGITTKEKDRNHSLATCLS